VDYNDEVTAQSEAEERKEYFKLLDALRNVVNTEDGKNVIWHILSQCGIYDGNFTGDAMTGFLLGKRDIGLMLIGLMHDADPAMYANLQLRTLKDGRSGS